MSESEPTPGYLRSGEFPTLSLDRAQTVAEIGSWYFDPAVGRSQWSKHMYRIVARDPSLGPPTLDEMDRYFEDGHWQLWRDAVVRATQNGTGYDLELPVTREDGRRGWIRVVGRASGQRSDAGYALFGTVQDISREKAMEEDRTRLAERVELGTRAANAGIWEFDIARNTLTWDDAMFELYGVDRANYSGTFAAWRDRLHPNDRPRMVEEVQLAIRKEKVFDTEFRVVLDDGEVRHIRGFARITDDDLGRPCRMTGINMDVTASRVAQRERVLREALLERAQRMGALGYFVVDIATSTFTSSMVLDELLELDDGFVKDLEHWTLLIHPDDREEAVRRLRAACERGAAPYDHVARTISWQSRRVRWFHSQGELELDEDGKPARLFGIGRDITAIKEREIELQQSRERLLEANQELARQTQRAQENARAADAANVAKSRFLANMSHEIRTPLNGIVGMAELLLDRTDDPELRALAEPIVESSNALMRIITDVLDFSKIEAGKVDLLSEPFDLHALLRSVASSFEPGLSQRGVELRVHLPSETRGRFAGDEGRIRQVVVNLMSNAAKFTRRGFVELGVRELEPNANPAKLEIWISDSGAGVPAEAMQALFEPFTQADSSGTREHGGTGLGLAIVRELVELMGGTVGVTSEAGRGSRFWFSLALPRLELADAPAVSARRKLHELIHPRLRGARVLLAEDNPTNRAVARGILGRLGMQVEVAMDGREALTAYRAAAPDLILMDIQMPHMDGLQCTTAIRAWESSESHRRVPIVALTANASSEDRTACLSAGMDDYLSKPVSPEQLAHVLSRWLPPNDATPSALHRDAPTFTE